MQTQPLFQSFRQRLAEQGTPITQWARDHGFNPYGVYRLLNGYELGTKGKSRTIAEAIESFVSQAA
ncbi:hypothetical protein [Thiothrix lacustris]|uniref:hypothetical protein n=1 Tax=Thiothrix lacustris TaxID=525917 RepID=UPI00057091F9|nr:hypothetical protein [Thiothrix lacustris]